MKFDIEHLNRLAERLDYKPDSQQHKDNLADYCTSDRMMAIAEAFRELEQRAEAAWAEAKHQLGVNVVLSRHNQEVIAQRDKALTQLSELAKQEPIYQLIDDGNWYDAEKYVYDECVRNGDKGRIVFTRAAPAAVPVDLDDTKRMDWLCAHCVEVRDPQMYGSHAMFHARQDSEEWDLPYHTTLREQVDEAMLKEEQNNEKLSKL